MSVQAIDYARYIDHTLLKMDATEAEIIKICQEAIEHHFYSVCVNSGYVPLVAKTLAGSEVKTCSVIGFPLGASLTSVKVFETQAAIAAGANEIDMVINVGWLKSGDISAFIDDIRQVKMATGEVILKVILETCLLSQAQIKQVCEICQQLNVDFVKTSTGFSSGGATVEDIKLMRETVGPTMGVKASGGVRSQETAKAMIAAGATRLGTSSGVAIVANQQAGHSHY
ncbi:deoxyribose-phosphate aldolase [Utexia brackfieldae]|uniref:deoxyribose-phosphate aldolase n=1 Tax=Utexia brackfieldae TaxID=3074108 RepID=UPI00370D5B8A